MSIDQLLDAPMNVKDMTVELERPKNISTNDPRELLSNEERIQLLQNIKEQQNLESSNWRSNQILGWNIVFPDKLQHNLLSNNVIQREYSALRSDLMQYGHDTATDDLLINLVLNFEFIRPFIKPNQQNKPQLTKEEIQRLQRNAKNTIERIDRSGTTPSFIHNLTPTLEAKLLNQIFYDKYPELTINLSFSQIKESLEQETEIRITSLENLALSRLIYGTEFEKSGIWENIKAEYNITKDSPRNLLIYELCSYDSQSINAIDINELAFLTILEADKVWFDPLKGLQLEFDTPNNTHESPSPLPTIRRFGKK